MSGAHRESRGRRHRRVRDADDETIEGRVAVLAGRARSSILWRRHDRRWRAVRGERPRRATCESLGYAPGVLACAPGCTFDTSGCPSYPQPGSCGNGTVESSESCDGVDLGGATCASLGYPLGGTLGCRAWCAYDTSGCVHGFPATGQMACWNGTGGAVACAGIGQTVTSPARRSVTPTTATAPHRRQHSVDGRSS
jgi:hypothetical protein